MDNKIILASLWVMLLSGCNTEQIEIDTTQVRPSLTKMDLSSPPSHADLIASGQLGGILSPTKPVLESDDSLLNKINPFTSDDSGERMAFGKAIQDWNEHNYSRAAVLFDNFRIKYPDSPWASEAVLHMGCEARFNGRYTEANQLFLDVIEQNNGNEYIGARSMSAKAKSRLAVLRVMENNPEQAKKLFAEVYEEAPGWRLQTYASTWLRKLSALENDAGNLLDCGTRALSYLLSLDGKQEEAEQVLGYIPNHEEGFSLSELVELSGKYGYQTTAVKLVADELKTMPLPAILQVDRKSTGGKGHYWILEKADADKFEIYDPQMKRRFSYDLSQLEAEWQGNALIFHETELDLADKFLSGAEMAETYGGCCGIQRPNDGLGSPGGNDPNDEEDDCANGAPVWSVNIVNMNLYVKDIPLWYSNDIGPDVNIELSYNTMAALAQNEPFGNKWMFNYSSYVVVDPGEAVTVFSPDGAQDVYIKDASGIYRSDEKINYTLNQLAADKYELVLADGSKRVYGVPVGTQALQYFLLEEVDPFGNKLTFQYDTNAVMQSIEDALGRRTLLNYNAQGLIESVEDPFGRIARFEYDEQRNLRSLTDMAGYTTAVGYDEQHFITFLKDAKGRTSFDIEPADGINNGSNRYPAPGAAMWANYRITVTDPLGNKEEYYYDGYRGLGWYVDKNNYVEYGSGTNNSSESVAKKIYKFTTPNGRKGEIASVTYPDGSFEKREYYKNNKIKSVTDQFGLVGQFTWNDKGYLTGMTDRLGNQTKYIYAENQTDLLRIESPSGTEQFIYNDKHQVISKSDINNHLTKLEYADHGLLTQLTDPDGYTTRYDYNESGQLLRASQEGKVISTYQYDNVGRVKTKTDFTGIRTDYSYDDIDTIIEINRPGNRAIKRVFSTCPRMMESESLPGGRDYKYHYNDAKHLIGIVDPLQGALRFERDKAGNLVKLIDKNNNETEFAYNSAGQLTNKVYADGSKVGLTYHKGKVKTVTNARGIIKTYQYNNIGQVIAVDYTDDTPSVSFEYDSSGKLAKVSDGIGTKQFQYYPDGRPKLIDGPYKDDAIELTYNRRKQPESISINGVEKSRFSYNAQGMVSRAITFGEQFDFTYSYDSEASGYSISYPNGITQHVGVDKNADLSSLRYMKSNTDIVQYSYKFDVAGNLVSLNSSASLDVSVTDFQADYNQLNQIAGWNNQTDSFAYDLDGNLTKGLLSNGTSFEASYDAENRLTSLRFQDGDILIREEFSYGYDNLLARYQRYEGEQLVITRNFVRLGLMELQERDANGNVVAEYAWEPGKPGGVGALLTSKRNGELVHYLYNHLGHVIATTDSHGTIVTSNGYSPYGMASGSDFNQQPFGFSTKRSDFASGLVYFGYRFYMPNIGRWLNRDPLEEEGGVNLYGYVEANPMNFIDADGRIKSKPRMPSHTDHLWRQPGANSQCVLDCVKDLWGQHDPKSLIPDPTKKPGNNANCKTPEEKKKPDSHLNKAAKGSLKETVTDIGFQFWCSSVCTLE